MPEPLYLICDSFGTVQMQLLEGKALTNGRVCFTGPFTECNRANRNNRIYPEEIMIPEFNRLKAVVEHGGSLIGELDHPDDSQLHLERGSHRITKLWWESKHIGYGEAKTIPTPFGLTLEAYFHEGVPVGVSSRGVGNGKPNSEGQLVIQAGYRCITYDTVADPSYQDAWQSIRESIMDDIRTGRKKVSMATPEMLAAARMESQYGMPGYTGPIVSTTIEEALAGEKISVKVYEQTQAACVDVDKLLGALSELARHL